MSGSIQTRLWAVHLGVVLAAAAAYTVAPGPAGRAAVYLTASGLTTVSVAVGIWLHRPPGTAPWRVLLAGVVTLLAANAIWIGAPVVGLDLGFPSVADGLFLAAYGLIVAALVLLVRERTKHLDRFGMLDAVIVAAGLGALSWVFVVARSVRQPGLGAAARIVSTAYPTVDLLLIGVAAWLVMSPGRRPPAFWLLGAYVTLQLGADTAYALTSLHGTFSQASLLVVGWILSYAGLGAALLHPTLPSLVQPGSAPQTSRWRLLGLTGAALVCPGTLVVQTLRGNHDDAGVVGALSAVLFIAVLARFAGLVSDVAQRHRSEDALRREARFVRLLHGTTSAASASESLDEALWTVVDQICTEMGWPVGHAITLDEHPPGGVTRRGGSCRTSDRGRFDELCRAIETTPVADSRSVAGRVVAAAGPVWLHPLPTVGAPWARAAGRAGVRSAFGFPVRIDNETVAVLQFFSDEDRPRDESLLQVTGDMGTQLGRVVERIRARQALTGLAYEDSLTGLPNRSRLMQILSSALAPGADRQVAVLFCDLDNFKFVNDSFGHYVGDEMLVAFAARLRSCLTGPQIACRLGGDEFAIVTDAADDGEAEVVAQGIVAALEEPFTVGTRQFYVSVSIGLALGRSGSESPDELLRRADIALHQAKAEGKNRFEVFVPAMLHRILARVEMEADLRSGLEAEEFTLHYQPKFCGRTGHVVGVEALVRWKHPVLGAVAPGEFIPVAEDTGLIVPLGAWVLSEACRAGRRWQDTYGPTFTMAVNVSARQLQYAGLVDTVIEALARSGISPSNLILEITESSLGGDVPLVAEQLVMLKKIGVQLAIDDFGTGHSSLDRLRRFPIDELKIDRSFVAEIRTADERAPLVAAIVAMGHGLGHRVVAEGVETPAQLTYLGRQRCDQIQGFILARPMPADELEAELDRRGTATRTDHRPDPQTVSI